MQERTKEDVNNDTSNERVEDSIVPQINEIIETEEAEEIKQEIQNYQPESFPAHLLPSSNTFAGLQETTQALEAMKTLAGTLVKSGLCPLKKVEDVVVAIITGNQFGFPFMTSINNIFPINGKPTLSVHLQRALILKQKVLFKKISNFEPIYTWAKVDNEGKVITKTQTNSQGQSRSVPDTIGNYTIKNKPIIPCVAIAEFDRITEYEFTRLIQLQDGSYKELVVNSEFRMSDAAKAGLLEKDVWVKYAPRMCDARAFAIGAREIASDITLGISTLNELADAHNIKYSVSENLEETVIIN